MPPRMAGRPLPYQTTDKTDRVSAKTSLSPQTVDPSRGLLQSTSPAKKFDWNGIRDSTDDQNLDMRNDSTIAAHRTAARTGTTFDLADLITDGSATKLPNMYLPADHPAMQIISLNESTLPGDVLAGGPSQPAAVDAIEGRMAWIIRERSLDLVQQVDDFLKRPAYSRMPSRNRAFLDVSTFKRALCYAFGDQWTRLAMTTDEFKAICVKHLKADAAHGSQQQDAQGFGQPEPLILWQPFAYGIMQMADGNKYKTALRGELDAERKALFEQQKKDAKAAEAQYVAEDGMDVGGAKSGTLSANYAQASAGLRANAREKAKEDAKPIGDRGARVGEVNAAKKIICDRLLEKNSSVRKALKDLDDDGSGSISRDEVKKFLRERNLLKYFDFHTGMTRGDLDPKVVDTLLDLVDQNGDGSINYAEFSNVVMAGVH